nr:WAS/WASL-interacting protein family member 1-like [Penaeus vannamei]
MTSPSFVLSPPAIPSRPKEVKGGGVSGGQGTCRVTPRGGLDMPGPLTRSRGISNSSSGFIVLRRGPARAQDSDSECLPLGSLKYGPSCIFPSRRPQPTENHKPPQSPRSTPRPVRATRHASPPSAQPPTPRPPIRPALASPRPPSRPRLALRPPSRTRHKCDSCPPDFSGVNFGLQLIYFAFVGINAEERGRLMLRLRGAA